MLRPSDDRRACHHRRPQYCKADFCWIWCPKGLKIIFLIYRIAGDGGWFGACYSIDLTSVKEIQSQVFVQQPFSQPGFSCFDSFKPGLICLLLSKYYGIFGTLGTEFELREFEQSPWFFDLLFTDKVILLCYSFLSIFLIWLETLLDICPIKVD